MKKNNYPKDGADFASLGKVNMSPMKLGEGRNFGSIEQDLRPTNRVVRNFKPSKPKKLPDLVKNFENKMSQLADSNVSPLGLFNQDLHAQREWNKLLVH